MSEHSSHSNQFGDDQQLGNDDSVLGTPLARFPHESFDASSFNESKSAVDIIPSKYIKNGFPVSHAPTLEVSPDSKLNYLGSRKHKYSEENNDNENQQQYDEKQALYLQNQLLKKQIQQRDLRQDNYIQKISELNQITLQLQKTIRQKDKIIQQKQQIILLSSRKGQSSKNVSQNYSKEKQKNKEKQNYKTNQSSTYIDQFCPEFLSPQESLQLFGELASKLVKSSTLRRKIQGDRKLIESISQLIRNK